MSNATSRTSIHQATLLARRDAVRGDIAAALRRIDADRYATLADQVHDTKDHAIAQALLDSNDAELQHAAGELRDIDAALARVTAGTYGRCTDCGAGIPDARLTAYPTAKRCLACQTIHERQR